MLNETTLKSKIREPKTKWIMLGFLFFLDLVCVFVIALPYSYMTLGLSPGQWKIFLQTSLIILVIIEIIFSLLRLKIFKPIDSFYSFYKKGETVPAQILLKAGARILKLPFFMASFFFILWPAVIWVPSFTVLLLFPPLSLNQIITFLVWGLIPTAFCPLVYCLVNILNHPINTLIAKEIVKSKIDLKTKKFYIGPKMTIFFGWMSVCATLFITLFAYNQLLEAKLSIHFWLFFFNLWAAFCGFILGFALSKSISNPIKYVLEGIKKMAAGDFTARVPIISTDETAELSSAFNAMVEDLQVSREQLERSKAETENIIQSQTDLVFLIDSQGIIRKVNQTVLKALGYEENELIGKSAAIVFHPDTLEENLEAGPKKALRGEPVINAELNLMTKKGEKLPLSFNGTPLRDASGEIVGGIGVGRDLREIQRLISELREAKVGLEEKVKERTKELEGKIQELEKFTKIAMGRELRMAELKEEIAKLKKEKK